MVYGSILTMLLQLILSQSVMVMTLAVEQSCTMNLCIGFSVSGAADNTPSRNIGIDALNIGMTIAMDAVSTHWSSVLRALISSAVGESVIHLVKNLLIIEHEGPEPMVCFSLSFLEK
jgi:hypothetical protein